MRYHACSSPIPDGGSQRSATAKTWISIIPSQNVGSGESERVEAGDRAVDAAVRVDGGKDAGGSPSTTASVIAVSVRRSVFGNASATSSAAGRRLTSDRPRLSWATSVSQTR